MQHRDLYPHEILQDVIDKSYAKSEGHLKTLAILSFLGGGYVSFGYMAYLKVVSGIPPEWGGLATLLGAAVFPICLICILIGGGELATGNMMMMALGRLTRRVSFKKLFRNWIVVSSGNLLGALYGVQAIPAEWLTPLELRRVIDAVANDLYATRDGDKNDAGLRERYPVQA